MDDTFNIEFEATHWSKVNRLLRQHGLPAIEIESSDNSTVGISFGAKLNQQLRDNIRSLMDDVSRRQALVQELIQTNNQLREELSAQSNTSESYESRSRDLRAMLENSNDKVQGLEQKLSNVSLSRDQTEDQTRNTNDEIKARVKQLKHKCKAYEEEIDRLKLNVKRMVAEDERRLQKQSQVFQQLTFKTSRGLDDKMVNIVDSYEKRIHQLRTELDLCKSNPPRDHSDNDHVPFSATPQYKEIIRAYEKEMKDLKKKNKILENDVCLLQLELQGRPELQDLRDCQAKLKKLQRIVKKHGLIGMEERFGKLEKKRYSTQVGDIDYLPLPHCRSYLKVICQHLGVLDLQDVPSKLEQNATAAEAYPRFELFAKEVLSIIGSEGVSKPHATRAASSSCHEIWCERSWHHAVPTLQHWCIQLQNLRELQASINRLHSTLLPWRQLCLKDDPPTVTKLIDAVAGIIHEIKDDNSMGKRVEPAKEQASRPMLQAIIDHFMNLFDVTRITGCYARMNDVYAKLGETFNVLKTLRDLLGLSKDCSSSAIVDSVARLCELQDVSAHARLKELLRDNDIGSIVRKLTVYNEFFPVFHDIMSTLMVITETSRIDQVVSAVRAFKMLLDAR